MRLSDEVEQLFVRHFAEDDKRKAMKYLNPNQRKESHAVTFFIGKIMDFTLPSYMVPMIVKLFLLH